MNIEEMTLLKDFVEGKIQRDKLENYRGSYKLGFFYTKDLQKAIETLLTAYEKEKGENVKLRLQDIPLIEGELKAYKDRVNELKAELEKEKEKNKKAIDFINERKKTVNKDMAEGTRLQVGTFMWQVDELLEILKEE